MIAGRVAGDRHRALFARKVLASVLAKPLERDDVVDRQRALLAGKTISTNQTDFHGLFGVGRDRIRFKPHRLPGGR